MALDAGVTRWLGQRRLRRTVPQLAAELRSIGTHSRALAAEHAHYVAAVSSADMAASLEAASVLRAICFATRPQRIADLGSGFSSYVVRDYGTRVAPPPEIHSVDDDPAWLALTADHLTSRGLSTDGLLPLSDLGDPRGAYDVVFYDLGRMPLRASFAAQAFGHVRPHTGLLLVDDMHKPDYAALVVDLVAEHRATLTDLRPWTLDRFGRYAVLVSGLSSGR